MAVTLNDRKICPFMRNINNIRNICIMAHVDHGKTTLADSLIASNGIISPRLAGKLRYMDSRKDEQERGITMKSSSISLLHKKQGDEYLINLIDSPGHVDFSLEVSTAVRLCDGALIMVDVVEGVCAQTRVSLKHAWAEKIKPLLVLNKIDRLITETKMAPMDAYVQLMQILEQVNSIMGDLFRSDVMEKSEETKSENISKTDDITVSDWSSGLDDADDSNLYFSPEEGNVIFASAIDGWGFTLDDFVEIFAKKLGFSTAVLRKTLWGNYYLNSKTKRVMKGAQEMAKKPLFVQLILENIWLFYDTITTKRDKDKTTHMIESLNIDLKPQLLRFNDPVTLLRNIFGKWLPLSRAILNSVCTKLPAPNNLSEEKIDNLMFGSKQIFYDEACAETLALKSCFDKCSQDENAPLIVFISKMFPVEKKHLPENRVKPLTLEEINQRREQAKQRLAALAQSDQSNGPVEPVEDEKPDSSCDETFIAFARIYSGRIFKGQKVYVLGPKHDPNKALKKIKDGYQINPDATLKDLKSDEHITQVEISQLYLLMGRELEPLDEVPAGNVFGIGGLEEHVLKSATLASDVACPAFSDLHVMATPILRVAVEPENPAQLSQLTQGLKLLNQADASVQVLVQETGEHVLITAGEVHLQRCIEDLRERYAKIPVLVSEPIIPFRETVVPPPTVDMVKEAITRNTTKQSNAEDGIVTISTSNGSCTIKIKAIPLSNNVIQVLEKNTELIKFVTASVSLMKHQDTDLTSKLSELNIESNDSDVKSSNHEIKGLLELKTKLMEAFKTDPLTANDITVDDIWSFGPKSCGPNILFNISSTADSKFSFWSNLQKPGDNLYAKYESSFLGGFQIASLSGPLCEEPMMGVGFVIYDWNISEDVTTSINTPYGPFSGQLMSTVKEGCRKSFQMQPQRLMAAMYTCNILVNAEVLGKMYGLLNKRHGRVLHGDLAQGSAATFTITAYLPVAESFRFASEVHKQTSGLANPQLVFSHWEVIDLDPFWTPNTEEEYLLYGEKADSENYARNYMNKVRKRKGLPTDEKVVEYAEKQRTLSKNK
ncbi:elongation factor-like GTPase 1 [Planococcus citri]|uniref:elongation factor-like GTPase 1 n=1 Tax=Planococcus citri TaxID=170843 RepID=UPI0031F9FE8B